MRETSVDVVVVGAGLSGLRAAQRVVEGGASVVVVEARDRVGGRTVNLPVGEGVFDLGGQWLGPTQDRVAALCKRYGVDTFPTWSRGKKVMDVGGKRSTYSGTIPSLSILNLVFLHRALRRIEKLARTVPLDRPHAAPRAAEWDALSLEAWKRDHIPSRVVRETVDIAVRVVFGAEANELSFLHFLHYLHSGGGLMRLVEIEGGAQQDRFVGGSQRLSIAMAGELGERVALAAPVDAVDQDGEGVTVRSGAREWRGRRAIVAIPPTLTARIRFDPALPGARDQLVQRFPMGITIKCVATYDAPFWRDVGYSGEAVATRGPVTVTFDNCLPDGGQPALVAFVVGNPARELSRLDPDARRREVTGALARFFGPAAGKPSDYRELDWSAEPWTRGCPTGIMPPGTMTNLAPPLRDPVGRVHWAGTETATEWTGYMEGALQAGERAADEVLSAL